jgi:crotonobetainyl-CoA:carnitine CoA-transferase CaiB-like acyl-CoA transferase
MPTQRPLAGVRILAVSQYGAGPFAIQQLADLGAEIVKIEHPDGGDVGRGVPPFADGHGSSLGEHTREVLRELAGLGDEEVDALARDRIIGVGAPPAGA